MTPTEIIAVFIIVLLVSFIVYLIWDVRNNPIVRTKADRDRFGRRI